MSGKLTGWSAIGKYLRVSPHTAKRWRDEWGLPVERVSYRVVQTTTTQVDNWLLALDKAHRELEVRGQVKLRADRLRIVEHALDLLWAGDRRTAA